MRYQIYWQPQTKLHELQGAQVDFQAVDAVYYHNDFLPSGQVIATWTDKRNYFFDKALADLPHLRPGQSYRSQLDVDQGDSMRAYLSFSFFDKENQLVDQCYQNTDSFALTVPSHYDHYRIELLSAGRGSFTFHQLTLTEENEGFLLAGDQQLTENLGAYLDRTYQRSTRTLTVIFAEPRLKQLDYPRTFVPDQQQAVLYCSTDLVHCRAYQTDALQTYISQVKKEVKAKALRFVGYGFLSAATALYYQELFEGATVCLPAPDLLAMPASYEHLPGDLQTHFKQQAALLAAADWPQVQIIKDHSLAANPSPVGLTHPNQALLRHLPAPEQPNSLQKRKRARPGQKQRLRDFFKK
ncbi:accessory Sec system protein Asp3 [Leuconostocaceae bacterium ESL0958]|nr:accessory Sec system protein Asp3 [Leuconostocaceae bacterium ESL0958]